MGLILVLTNFGMIVNSFNTSQCIFVYCPILQTWDALFFIKIFYFRHILAPETRWSLARLCITQVMFIYSKRLTVLKGENSKNWICTRGSNLHISFPANRGLVLIKLSGGMLICKWERVWHEDWIISNGCTDFWTKQQSYSSLFTINR